MSNNAQSLLELSRLLHFVKVVEENGFSAAARALGATKSTVSRNVSDLEARLGVRLLSRTTRRLSLTDEGRRLYERSGPLLQGMNAALREAAGSRAAPRGTLRVYATTALGRFYLSDLFPLFLARFPEVSLDLTYAERTVDLVHEGFDVAFLAGPRAPHAGVVKQYGPAGRMYCASKGYLARRGLPRSPEDLQHHDCLAWSERPGDPVSWRFTRADRSVVVKVTPRVRCNSADELRALLEHGAGIGCPPEFALSHRAARNLVRVLPAWVADPLSFGVVSPVDRRADPKVSEFLRFIIGQLDARVGSAQQVALEGGRARRGQPRTAARAR